MLSAYLKDSQLPEWGEEFLASTLLCGQVPQRHPSQAFGPSPSCGFLPTCHSEGTAQHLANFPQPDRAEKEGVPRVQTPLANPHLLGSVKRRDHHAGCHTSVVCHTGQVPSRHILQSSPRAPPAPGSDHRREQLV